MQTITENPTLPLPRQCLDYGGRVRCDCGRRRHCRMCRCLGNDVIWLQMSPAGEKRNLVSEASSGNRFVPYTIGCFCPLLNKNKKERKMIAKDTQQQNKITGEQTFLRFN